MAHDSPFLLLGPLTSSEGAQRRSCVESVETARPARLRLLDLSGRVVRTTATAQRRHEVDLTGLAPGVYLVRAQGADGAAAVQRLLVR